MPNHSPVVNEKSQEQVKANFFQVARNLADPDQSKANLIDFFPDNQDFLSQIWLSPILDASFQERVRVFGLEKPNLEFTRIAQEPINSAPIFHQKVLELLDNSQQKNFLISLGKSRKKIAVTNGILFMAHRLRKKSWQEFSGVKPDIRYFHAAFRSRNNLQHSLDIVYWIKFDEENNPSQGSFVNPENQEIKIWC